MLTIDDVQSVPLFSSLAKADRTARAYIRGPASRSGRIRRSEGGERALYAVISGKIEVVKSIDGVERRLGWRVPGAIFGEVPIGYAVSRRLSRVGAITRHAGGAPAVLRDRGGIAGDFDEDRRVGARACKASPPNRRSRASQWWGPAGTSYAAGCAASFRAIRSALIG
jgi:thioredoxin reductase (NADPH)